MKLSIVIVNYNVKYFLEQCLLSIQSSNVDFKIETIVVDNNSSDGSVDYLKPKFPWISFIENKDNPGFSKANNQAMRIAQGDYILILNPDTVLGENVLRDSCSFMDTNISAGAIGVKMINGYGEFLAESKRGLPTPWASFCKIFGLAKLFPESSFFGQYHLKYLDENAVHEVDILAGAFMLIRKSALDKTGLFDESFFMYGEDIDLSYRIIKAGFKNYYLPVKIIHYKGESTKKGDMKYVKAFYLSMYIFFKKHFPNYGKLYSLFIKAGISVRGSFSAINSLWVKIFGTKKKINTSDVTVLDHSLLSYKQIIDKMDSYKNKNTEFRIYSPESGFVIGPHYAEKQTGDA